MLTGLQHGKLINFGRDRVDHEFVNCLETPFSRRRFEIGMDRWRNRFQRFDRIVTALVRDWGTGLAPEVYQEAIIHFLGGLQSVSHRIPTYWDTRAVTTERANLFDEKTAFFVTGKRRELEFYERHLRRFLAHTDLEAITWVNIQSGRIDFVLIDG